MISRRHLLGGSAAAGLALSSCARAPAAGDHVVRYWGMGAADADKDEAVRDAFLRTEAGKDARIHIDQVPSNGAADMSPIITAVRGNTAPDVWWMGRFTAVQSASIGLLEPLDPLIEEFEGVSPEEFMSQWVQFAVDEVTYDGGIYGLPTDTDARALMYNEDVMIDAGVDLDMLDPDQHVMTWGELREAARKVMTVDGRGNYTRFGFAPWLDEGWPYTWGFGLGAEVYDNDTATVTLDSPEWAAVYELYADWAEEFPYASVDTFFATYQPPNSPPSQSAMFSGRLGFTTTGPWSIQGNEKYAPDLPLKFTWLPVTSSGDETYTWSGGFSLAIPKGANITRTLWEYMTFHAGFEGQSIIQPAMGNLPTHLRAIEEKKYNPAAEIFRQMLPTSIARPPLPAGQAIWDTLDRTRVAVPIGSETPAGAAEVNQDYVEPKMDLFSGYRMPDSYGQPNEIPG
ncbi:extracellular solute-binding protein [Brachybacterium sp. YJGR34]|uniref:extracellular solute-binding protein n=1 Tax=Brachybacterium sp. YJGR34 TaxID=2059911 RepID=UPI000E0A20A9|nr:extracellular solute-binding protein [Brachybacterium sp. YJGR34]